MADGQPATGHTSEFPEVPSRPFAAPCRPICPHLSSRQNSRTARVRGRGQHGDWPLRVTCLHPEPTSGGGGVSRCASQAGRGCGRGDAAISSAPSLRPQVSDARTLELQLPPYLPHLATEQAFQTHQWLFLGNKDTNPRWDPSPAASRPHPSSSPPAPPPQPSWPSAAPPPCPGLWPSLRPGPRQSSPATPPPPSPAPVSPLLQLPSPPHPPQLRAAGQLPDQGPGGNLALAAASGVHSPTPRHVTKNRPYFPGLQRLSSDPHHCPEEPEMRSLEFKPSPLTDTSVAALGDQPIGVLAKQRSLLWENAADLPA
ncbi:hypothetical protein AB1E18_015843 [Capra hircus]